MASRDNSPPPCGFRPGARLATTAVVAVLILVGAACSSGGSDDAESASAPASVATTEPSGSDDAPSSDASSSDVDCQALLQGRAAFVSSVNQLTVLDDPDAIDLAVGDAGFEQIETYIVLLRPYQDVEIESFEPVRTGLDNLEADLGAIREGRLDDRVGGYPAISISALLDELGC